jgi:hypothetical protein
VKLRKRPRLREQAADLVGRTEEAVAVTERAVADVAGDVQTAVRFAGDEVARAASVVALCVQLLTAAALVVLAVAALRQASREVA